MTQDRHGLCQLEVPIDVVRQVGKGETLQVGIDLIHVCDCHHIKLQIYNTVLTVVLTE